MNSYCIATDEENVLIIGGNDKEIDNRSTTKTHLYSISQDTWSRGPNLNRARYHAKATYLGGFIYTFFGEDQKDQMSIGLSSIERIDTRTFKEW